MLQLGWVGVLIFQTGYDIMMSCMFLAGFRKIKTHSKTRDDYHMSIFGSGRDRQVVQKGWGCSCLVWLGAGLVVAVW